MGVSVRKRKGQEEKGYWIFVRHKNVRYAKLIGDRRQAEQVAKEIRARSARDDLNLPVTSSPLLRDYFPQWLDTYIKPWRKPATYATYTIAWNKWIAPTLGDRPVATITKNDVRAMVAHWRESGLVRNSIKGHLAPLSACFTQAVEDTLVAVNPVERALPKVRGEGKGHKGLALKRDQLAHLLTVCQQKYPRWYPLVLLWGRTGLRLGEALALRWGDVDFDRTAIAVCRTLPAHGEKEDVTPKGGRIGERVDMSQHLTTVLLALKPALAEEKDLVFPSNNRTPMHPSNFRIRVWYPLLTAAGLPRIRIQDLRHTVATLLLELGEPVQYVQQQLRHRSIRTTVDVYGHLDPGYNRGAVDKLDEK